jgi:hypothetical protein
MKTLKVNKKEDEEWQMLFKEVSGLCQLKAPKRLRGILIIQQKMKP